MLFSDCFNLIVILFNGMVLKKYQMNVVAIASQNAKKRPATKNIIYLSDHDSI